MKVGQGHVGEVGECIPGNRLTGVLVRRGRVEGQPTDAAQLDQHGAVQVGELLRRGVQRLVGPIDAVRPGSGLAAENPAGRGQQQRRDKKSLRTIQVHVGGVVARCAVQDADVTGFSGREILVGGVWRQTQVGPADVTGILATGWKRDRGQTPRQVYLDGRAGR